MMRFAIAAVLMLSPFAAVAQTPPAASAPMSKTVMLKDAKGADAGTATLTATPKGVLVRVTAKGLTPGWHGIHFHSVGDCSDGVMGFKKSGGHVHEMTPSIHGLLNPQANDEGDLPNLYAGADGMATADLFTTLLTMDKLADADGSAIVIHAKPDDYMTQPIGGAGDRVACGVVK